MHPLNRTARLAGFLYLLVLITGFYTLMYVPGKLFVPGDAAATASNILAHQSLFRAYSGVEFLSELFFIATVLALYQLLNAVGPRLAILMVLLVLLDTPLAFAGIAADFVEIFAARAEHGDRVLRVGRSRLQPQRRRVLRFKGPAQLVQERQVGVDNFAQVLRVVLTRALNQEHERIAELRGKQGDLFKERVLG